jgi:hypothetical protein
MKNLFFIIGEYMDEPITTAVPGVIETVPEKTEPSQVAFENGFALSVTAHENVSMSKAGAITVHAENDLELTNGGAGAIVSGNDIKINNGGACVMVSGGNLELTNGCAQTMVIGGDMELTNGGATLVITGGDQTVYKGFIGIALAPEVHLNEGSQLLLDTPRALVFGAAFGAVFALVRWLLKR